MVERKKRKLSDTVKEYTDAVKEAKNLIKEIDGLINSISDAIQRRVSVGMRREPISEVIDYGDEVVIISEVGMGVMPDVRYSKATGKVMVDIDGDIKTYNVGCVDEKTISAEIRNGILTVRARRCRDESDRVDKEDVQEG